MKEKTHKGQPVFLDLFLQKNRVAWAIFGAHQVLVLIPVFWNDLRPIISYFAEAFILTFTLLNIYLYKTKKVFFVHGELGDYAEKCLDRSGVLGKIYVLFNLCLYLFMFTYIFIRN